MRRVSFLITGLDRGGAETQVVRVASGLRRRGWTVRVITLLPPADLAGALGSAGVPVTWAGLRRGRSNLTAIARLTKLLRRDRPDVLVAFLFHANVLARLCGRAAGIPVVVSSIRNVRFEPAWRAWVERATSRLDSATTTNSWIVANVLRQRGIVRPDRLQVIPNGLPLDEYRGSPEARRRVRQDAGLTGVEFLWLSAGSLSPQKDHLNLLRAFSHVHARVPDARLWISGDGPLRARLEQEIASLGLAAAVRLLGLRDDVALLLNAADAAVLSSGWEGLPNVIMEALAVERPVVATAVGGVPDLVRDGVTGVLAPPRHPRALADAMIGVMRMEPGERRRMGAAGRAEVEARFQLDAVLDTWESMLIRLTKSKG